MKNLEIERKFLIKMPDIKMLEVLPDIGIADITQTYTTVGVRLRKWTEQGRTTYIKTVKKHLSDLTRIEEESEISAEEYNSLMLLADPERNSLTKTRYRYPFKGKLIEIDVFPFWERQAFCEIELKGEDEEFSLPDFIEVIKEVSADKAYRNYALTKNIPKEENF